MLTDFRTDPFFNYDPQGRPNGQWQDPFFCHALLFMPDFDGQTLNGNPIPWSTPGI